MISADEELGHIYLPTNTTAPDFYGGHRHGDNLFANCLVALDAASGRRLWHYQIVHHDLLDKLQDGDMHNIVTYLGTLK